MSHLGNNEKMFVVIHCFGLIQNHDGDKTIMQMAVRHTFKTLSISHDLQEEALAKFQNSITNNTSLSYGIMSQSDKEFIAEVICGVALAGNTGGVISDGQLNILNIAGETLFGIGSNRKIRLILDSKQSSFGKGH